MLKIPDTDTINVTFDSDVSELDFSSSEQIKNELSKEMNLDLNEICNVRFAWVSTFEKKDGYRIMSIGKTYVAAMFKPRENIILLSVDCQNIDKLNIHAVHEVGHAISLQDTYVTLCEGCALYYERDWCKKKGMLEKFRPIKSYLKSITLLDLIKDSIFNGNEKIFLQAIKKGNDKVFLNILDRYLLNKGYDITINQLLFWLDVMHFYELDYFQYITIERKRPFFWNFLDFLYNDVVFKIFNNTTDKETITQINRSIEHYRQLINICYGKLEQISNISKIADNHTLNINEYLLDIDNCQLYLTDSNLLERTYCAVLAHCFHELDVKQCSSRNIENPKYDFSRISDEAMGKSLDIVNGSSLTKCKKIIK